MNTLELDHALKTLIIQGRSVEAFQKFYAEDVVALAQVAVRRWKDGKVVRERFYHK